MITEAPPPPQVAAPPETDNGLISWLTTVDHKRIGILYLITTFVFFLIGGILALVLRLQLEHTNNTLVSAEAYNQVMTMHGTTMIFLFVVPVMAGFGNYLVPLQIGARDMAFPRLNALSFWLLLFGAVVLYAGFVWGGGPADSGWTSYPPLSVLSPGHGQDLWIVGLHVIGISSLIGAINFLCTIHNMRAPGMRLSRMPLFTWTIEIYSIMIVVAGPVLAGALTMLLLDPTRHQLLATPAHAGNVGCCTSTCSGSTPTRPCTSWCCRRFGHDLRDPAGVLAQAAVRLPARWCTRSPRSPSSASWCGATTCSRRVLRAAADLVHVRVDADRHPHRCQDLQLDRHHVDGQVAVRAADALRRRVHRPVHHRRPLGDPAGGRTRSISTVTDTYFIVAHFHYVLAPCRCSR